MSVKDGRVGEWGRIRRAPGREARVGDPDFSLEMDEFDLFTETALFSFLRLRTTETKL